MNICEGCEKRKKRGKEDAKQNPIQPAFLRRMSDQRRGACKEIAKEQPHRGKPEE